MLRDGNCFFHAITAQNNIFQNCYKGLDFHKLREKVIDHILKHPTIYAKFVTGNLHTFVGKLMQDGTWADDIVPLVLSRTLNVNLVIVHSEGPPTIVRREAPVGTLYLGYEVGQHYQSLRFNDKLTASKDLQTLLNRAPIDPEIEEEDLEKALALSLVGQPFHDEQKAEEKLKAPTSNDDRVAPPLNTHPIIVPPDNTPKSPLTSPHSPSMFQHTDNSPATMGNALNTGTSNLSANAQTTPATSTTTSTNTEATASTPS